jgi:endonuclease III
MLSPKALRVPPKSDPRRGSRGAEKTLEIVCERLRSRYPFDNLGNKADPLDELIYIVLSTRTRGTVFESMYDSLLETYGSWEAILNTPARRLEKHLAPAGLARKKAAWLRATLREIRMREGAVSLSSLRHMTDAEAEAYLLSLPGVGVKTARCVEMYSLDREVLPVDANVRRFLERLELIPAGVHYAKVHDLVHGVVPKHVRVDLHIYAVIHGRETCRPRNPACSSCVVNDLCPYPAKSAR